MRCVRRRFSVRESTDRRLRFGFCWGCRQKVQALGEFELHGLGYRKCQIFVLDTRVDLAPNEARLFWVLLIRLGKFTSFGELIGWLYPYPDLAPQNEEGILKQNLARLRKKLGYLGIKIKTTYYLGPRLEI